MATLAAGGFKGNKLVTRLVKSYAHDKDKYVRQWIKTKKQTT